MKKHNINLKRKGNKKNINYSLNAGKTILGHINYKLDIFINNRYLVNRYLKFSENVSKNSYNSALLGFKND